MTTSEGAERRAGMGRRVPPSNLAAEESLLGAMLMSRDAIDTGAEMCTAEDFYKPSHGHVFDAVCRLHAAGEPADGVTVADELARTGLLDAVGGPAVLVSLQAGTPATSNAASYAHIVVEHALLRRLVGVGGELVEIGYSLPDDVDAALDAAERHVFDLTEERVRAGTLTDASVVLAELVRDLEALVEHPGGLLGVPTGYLDLDDRLLGLQPSKLTVVAARPAVGKTAFALGAAVHVATHVRRPVVLFTPGDGPLRDRPAHGLAPHRHRLRSACARPRSPGRSGPGCAGPPTRSGRPPWWSTTTPTPR